MRTYPITFTNTKTGAQITTKLDGNEAEFILRKIVDSNFVASLLTSFRSKDGLKGNQRYYYYKLAEDNNPENKVNNTNKESIRAGEGMKNVADMFIKAKNNGIEKPKIRLQNNGRNITLSLAGENSANKGYIYIKTGKGLNAVYCGKISPEGIFSQSNGCDSNIVEYIKNFAGNPLDEMIKYGRVTNNCSCCGRTLTNELSVSLGIGPWCRSRFGM